MKCEQNAVILARGNCSSDVGTGISWMHVFEIRLTEAKSYSAQGKDDAEFYLSVNPGEPVRPLGDVASGELYRIMLAIKTVLADEEDTPTLIFDEI